MHQFLNTMSLFFRYYFYVLVSVWLLHTATLFAQQPTIIAPSTTTVEDSVRNTLLMTKDTTKNLPKAADSENNRFKSATKAALWSFIPAGGTVYNRQYTKTPIYGASLIGLSTLTVQQYIQYRKHYKTYTTVLANRANGIDDPTDLTPIRQKKQQTLANYNLFRNISIAAYTYTIVDSYISNLLIHEPKRPHSPLKAAYRSGLLPGLGQAYNRKYWKIPIIYAGFGSLGYSIYSNGTQSERYKEEYLARTRPGYGNTDDRLSPISTDNLLRIRSQYKRYYDLSIILTAVWYVVNIADATVDGHLHEFDISDDLSYHDFQIRPHLNTISQADNPNTPLVGGLTLSWKF